MKRPEDVRNVGEWGLVERARAGDMDAFDKLYRSNVSRIYALAWRLSGDSVLAEELTQDVFVRAWEKLPSFRGDSAFSTWLYPITINVALSERRSRLRRTAHVEPVEDLSSFEGPKDRDHEAGFDLEKAIAKLPPGARSIFVLHDVEGYRHEEIADLTGVAAGTSKAQLHRARKLLREALGR